MPRSAFYSIQDERRKHFIADSTKCMTKGLTLETKLTYARKEM